MSCDYIEDGYTETGYITAVDGIHGELRFEYRPAVGRIADRITGMIQGPNADWERWWDESSKALAVKPGLLKAWSIKDRKGNAVPITAANIQNVRQLLIHKLWMIVAGQMASDPEPLGGDASKVDLEADSKN